MDRGNTKQAILDAALDLFSVKGFEATSISMIAEAVGIRKASLYSHFDSKQAILDALVEEILHRYNSMSLLSGADREEPQPGAADLSPDRIVSRIKAQILFILHDPQVSRARKMLAIEQFQNAELARLYTKQSYADVMRYGAGLIELLIRQGVLAPDDPEIMAAQLCLPISMWTNLCDREPEREDEVMALIERHIRQFFRMYRR